MRCRHSLLRWSYTVAVSAQAMTAGGEGHVMNPNPSGRQGTLRIDPMACQGIGMCAHLAPELVGLDRWGFPVLPRDRIDANDARAAVRAVRGCPRKALRFIDVGTTRNVPSA